MPRSKDWSALSGRSKDWAPVNPSQQSPASYPVVSSGVIVGQGSTGRFGGIEGTSFDVPDGATVGFHVDQDGNWAIGGTSATSGNVSAAVSGILTALSQLAVKRSGDAGARYAIDSSSGLLGGDGTTTDTVLSRPSANTWALGTDDSLRFGNASKLGPDYIELPELSGTDASPSRVQTAVVSALTVWPSSSVTLTWSPATTTGNFLVMAVAANTTITTPSGWTLATAVLGSQPYLAVYYKENAASQSSVAVTAPSADYISIVGAEYSGVKTSSSIDNETSDSSGTNLGTSASTGTTATTAQAYELWIGAIMNWRSQYVAASQSGPTNGFTQLATTSVGTESRARVGLYEKMVTATGTASTTVTLASSQYWEGKVATFKGGTGGSLAGSANAARLYVDESGGKTRLMAIFGSGAAQQVAIEPP